MRSSRLPKRIFFCALTKKKESTRGLSPLISPWHLYCSSTAMEKISGGNVKYSFGPKFTERLRYRIDNFLAGGPRGQLLLLGILSLGVVGFGMLAYFFGLFESAEVEGVRRGIDGGFWDTLWWSAKHIVDPATFDMDYGSRWPVIILSVLVSLMGMVIFGSFIGLISAAVENKVGSLNKGRSPAIESGHVLILGWSNRVFPVIDMLHELNVGRKIVALAEKDVEEMREDLRVNCWSRSKKRVILRTGSPTSMVELQRVGFDRAFSIIVLADESAATRGEEADISVIKTLMLLSSEELWAEPSQRPKMVAEITKSENVEIAEIAGQRHIPVICSSQIIGKVVVQTARQPGLAAVYGQIFFGGGSQIYVQSFPEIAGKKFHEIMHCFPGGIPLGVSSAKKDPVDGFVTYVPYLNPRADYVIGKDEWMILLCERMTNHYVPAPSVEPPALPITQAQTRQQHVIERIVILGWNRGLYGVLMEIDEYALSGATVLVVAGHDDETASALIAKEIGRPLRNVQLKYRQGDYLRRAVLEDAVAGNPSCICILRDESTGETDLDARLIMASVLLRDHQRQLGVDQPRSHVVAEVSSPENRELLERTSGIEVIAGPEVASWLLTQISQQQMLLRVYCDLLNAGGNEIYLKPAGRYVTPGTSASFAQIREQAQRLGEIAIGLMRTNRSGGFESLINPTPGQSFVFGEKDKVIVIAEDLFLESARQHAAAHVRSAEQLTASIA